MNVILSPDQKILRQTYLLDDDFLDAQSAGAINGTKSTSLNNAVPSTRVTVDTYAATELIVNGGFETVVAAGPPANFGTWAESVGTGQIEAEGTLVHAGSYACKLTAGATANTSVYAVSACIPGKTYNFTFWTRGDGTNAGRYSSYDATAGAWIANKVSTGVSGTVYTQVTVPITAPAGCASITFDLVCPAVNGGIAYFDTVSCTPTTGLLSISA